MIKSTLNITNTAIGIMFFFTPALCQIGKTGEMVVADAGLTVKAQVLMHAPKINTDQSRLYYWYRSDKILNTRGGWEGKLLHGPYTAFYPNKNLKEKGQFRYGLKTGQWSGWYANGQLREVTWWKEGVKQGSFQEYGETGQLIKEGRYINDRLDGRVITYQSGKVTGEEIYNNGEPVVKQKVDKKQKGE